MSRPGGATAYERAERLADPNAIRHSLNGVRHTSYWLDSIAEPQAEPALDHDVSTDLVVVGGGYTGLWTALLAKERDPAREVMLLEGQTCGWAASGRNGGFVEPSLTHGRSNGELHLPDEVDELDRLGRDNLAGLCADVERLGIDCDMQPVGVLRVATEEYQRRDLAAAHPTEMLDRDAVCAEVDSPLYRAGVWDHEGCILVHPGKLALGLRAACLKAGVRMHEHTTVRSIHAVAGRTVLRTDQGVVTARRIALATNAARSLLASARYRVIPVYDYAIVTEPLSAQQRESIGWNNGQGIADMGERFHYYRPTPDGRILFGGYDAIYHWGRKIRPEFDIRPESFERLAAHFQATFPTLSQLRFTHAWGGAIDTSTRFFCFFERAHSGRVVQANGFTGLGVAASRFAARVTLDLLAGTPTALTQLDLVRRKPLPFPPEPAASLGIKLTVAELARSERRGGRRSLWLHTLDRFGLGFSS
ncbi:glycine/D-amino acid oxidase-like deaminating enzyme [Mycobacterium frederiksbergense]|uniref:Glycine/D-amino acid oxidase-like deaminating enzyme n=1 Tax=Mycolicibacterium frederiksbergense TaxID=117567 RepID=A0ABT6KT48_9MYCO|nr:FAD-dependent oxidoreductase [Mycolicibacterium frederiksbergense]MDH6193758.1 glycine/D-amino acid oxidase-like deaminating enzyme [Mycolicibacterium frederiksbergense]